MQIRHKIDQKSAGADCKIKFVLNQRTIAWRRLALKPPTRTHGLRDCHRFPVELVSSVWLSLTFLTVHYCICSRKRSAVQLLRSRPHKQGNAKMFVAKRCAKKSWTNAWVWDSKRFSIGLVFCVNWSSSLFYVKYVSFVIECNSSKAWTNLIVFCFSVLESPKTKQENRSNFLPS